MNCSHGDIGPMQGFLYLQKIGHLLRIGTVPLANKADSNVLVTISSLRSSCPNLITDVFYRFCFVFQTKVHKEHTLHLITTLLKPLPELFFLSVGWREGRFPGVTSGKEPTCQCRSRRSCGFSPWVRKIL